MPHLLCYYIFYNFFIYFLIYIPYKKTHTGEKPYQCHHCDISFIYNLIFFSTSEIIFYRILWFFFIYAHFLEEGCINKVTWAYEVISTQFIQYRTISVWLANNSYLFSKPISLIMQQSLQLDPQFLACIHKWMLEKI